MDVSGSLPGWERWTEGKKLSATHIQHEEILSLEVQKKTQLFNIHMLLYLKDGDLPPRDGEGHCHALAVDTEAITLAWRGQVQAAHVGNVCVPVHHCSLDVTELGGRPWMRDHSPFTGLSLKERSWWSDRYGNDGVCVHVYIPSMLWMALALWLGLGLGTKPEERPEVEEGERDGTALLLGVLRGLLEVEQPWAGSCRKTCRVYHCHRWWWWWWNASVKSRLTLIK